MLSGGLFEGLAAIAIAAAGGLIIIGQLKSLALKRPSLLAERVIGTLLPDFLSFKMDLF